MTNKEPNVEMPKETFCEAINQNLGSLCEEKTCLSYNFGNCEHRIKNQTLSDYRLWIAKKLGEVERRKKVK